VNQHRISVYPFLAILLAGIVAGAGIQGKSLFGWMFGFASLGFGVWLIRELFFIANAWCSNVNHLDLRKDHVHMASRSSTSRRSVTGNYNYERTRTKRTL
jgi:hypothetical protein